MSISPLSTCAAVTAHGIDYYDLSYRSIQTGTPCVQREKSRSAENVTMTVWDIKARTGFRNATFRGDILYQLGWFTLPPAVNHFERTQLECL